MEVGLLNSTTAGHGHTLQIQVLTFLNPPFEFLFLLSVSRVIERQCYVRRLFNQACRLNRRR